MSFCHPPTHLKIVFVHQMLHSSYINCGGHSHLILKINLLETLTRVLSLMDPLIKIILIQYNIGHICVTFNLGSCSSATCVATSSGTQSLQRSQARPRPSHRLPQCSPHSCCRPRGRPSTLRPLTFLRSRACCNSKSACTLKVKLPGRSRAPHP